MLLAIPEHIIPFAIRETIAILHRNNGDDFSSALNVLLVHVGKRDMANLALLAQAGQRFHGSVEGNSGVGDVELVNIDAIEAKAFEAAFDGFGEMFWAGIVQPLQRPAALPSTFGGDH